ncbi:MAG: MFS transporter, partial [Saccharolobus sp.]
MKPLRIYALLNNLANSIVNPFIAFFTASNNITGVLLAIVSSASTVFPGVIQYLLVNVAIRARKLIAISTLGGGLLWIFVG